MEPKNILFNLWLNDIGLLMGRNKEKTNFVGYRSLNTFSIPRPHNSIIPNHPIKNYIEKHIITANVQISLCDKRFHKCNYTPNKIFFETRFLIIALIFYKSLKTAVIISRTYSHSLCTSNAKWLFSAHSTEAKTIKIMFYYCTGYKCLFIINYNFCVRVFKKASYTGTRQIIQV